MGLFAKLKNGKKKFYKAIQKCDSTNNGGVVIACKKMGVT